MVKINELLGNKSLVNIIIFLIDNDEELSQTKIRNKIKIAKATLIKWLNYLEKNNFVNVKIEGVSKLYKLNKEITLQIFNDLEWANMGKKDAAFYERVEKDKIEV